MLHRDPEIEVQAPASAQKSDRAGDQEADWWSELSSDDDAKMLIALEKAGSAHPDRQRTLSRWIARDDLFHRARRMLPAFPPEPVAPLIEMLRNEETDFVVRRRIPEFLAGIGEADADDVLLDLLNDRRFEVRYRAAVALAIRRKQGFPLSERDWISLVWQAVVHEVRKDRPVWELQKLLDDYDSPEDGLLGTRVGVRGELSLEHTFRLLSLVLDPVEVRAAYHGVILDDPELKSYALEYLEQVLPSSVRRRLWLFIGDVSVRRQERQMRPLADVVADIMATGQTLLGRDFTKLGLRGIADGADRADPRGEAKR